MGGLDAYRKTEPAWVRPAQSAISQIKAERDAEMKKEHYTSWIISLIVAAAFTAIPAQADELYARIRGTVVDPSGANVSGAQIAATNEATGIARELISGGDGSYELISLPVGTYTVSASKNGFKKFETTGVVLAVNQVYVLNIPLSPGGVTEVVRVEANPVQVETTDMQLGAVVDGQAILDLPLNGRDWIQLQQLQPGVVSQSDRRTDTYATNGSQAQQNSFLINGADSNNFFGNTPAIIPSPDAIAEFRMVTNTLNPEYGRNSGAIMNAVIKSGALDYLATDRLDAVALRRAIRSAVRQFRLMDVQRTVVEGSHLLFSFLSGHAGEPRREYYRLRRLRCAWRCQGLHAGGTGRRFLGIQWVVPLCLSLLQSPHFQ